MRISSITGGSKLSVGTRVKDLREQRGLTQLDLKNATGLSQATISRIESGEFENLRSDTLTKLADSLRVTSDYLLGRSDAAIQRHPFGIDLGAKELLRIFQGLDEETKRALGSFAEFLEMKANNGLE
jgi:transcriptional regulator with XRE-family HTH domain